MLGESSRVQYNAVERLQEAVVLLEISNSKLCTCVNFVHRDRNQRIHSQFFVEWAPSHVACNFLVSVRHSLYRWLFPRKCITELYRCDYDAEARKLMYRFLERTALFIPRPFIETDLPPAFLSNVDEMVLRLEDLYRELAEYQMYHTVFGGCGVVFKYDEQC